MKCFLRSIPAVSLWMICFIHLSQAQSSDSEKTLVSCDFEGPCDSLSVVRISKFDWQIQQQQTKSVGTGPIGDHTLGGNGHFMYTEASGEFRPNQSLVAVMQTEPALKHNSNQVCVRFWYHMYGSLMGNLSVQFMVNGNRKTVWKKSGNQGDVWKEANIELETTPGEEFRVQFEANRGSGYLSDICIDDITITSCGNGNDTGDCSVYLNELSDIKARYKMLEANYTGLLKTFTELTDLSKCQQPSYQHNPWALPRWMKWQKFENEAKTQVLERVLAARPTNLAELQATVKFARSANLTIRAAGSSHSWSPLFTEENQMLVYMGDVTYDDICKSRLHINHQKNSVTMVSGVTAGELKEFLASHNVSIPTNTLTQEVTMGGAVGTMSHGVGSNEKMIGDRVIKMRILNSEGELVTYDLSDEDSKLTKAVRGHLGLFGIVYDMTMKVDNPMEVVNIQNRWMKTKEIFYDADGLKKLLDDNWSVSLMWFPFSSLPLAGRVGGFVMGGLQPGLWDPSQDDVLVQIGNKVPVSTCQRAPPMPPIPKFPEMNTNNAGLLIPYFISEFLKPLIPDQFTRPYCMPDAVHTPILSEISGLIKTQDLEVAIDVNPADGYSTAMEAVRQLISSMTTRSMIGQFPTNTAINMRFLGYSDIFLSPSQAGNPKNGGSGHTLYLNINSITETEGWEDFIKEVTSKWRQIPGLRFHWAKQWGMLNGIEDFIRDSYGDDMKQFLGVLEESRADPYGMFFNKKLEKIFYPGGHPGKKRTPKSN